MSEIVKIGLRLVKTTYYITTQNTKKFLLQSICHMENACSHIIKNLIASAQKQSAGCWKIIKIYRVPLTIIGMNIAIYYAYKIKTNRKFWKHLNMWIAAEYETLKYSIIPLKTITSGVLFDDGEMTIFTREGNVLLKNNNNTRNLILSEELDANIQEPFPRGEPIPIKIGEINGLLDNGKLTLEDGDTTFNFHHTLSLEVKKTSTTLQDEIAAMEKEPSKIQLRKISNFYMLIPDKQFYHRIKGAKEKKPSKIQQTKIGKFNVLVPDNELSLKTSKDEYKWPDTTVDRSNPVYLDIFPTTENFSFSFDSIIKIQPDDSDEVFYIKQNVNFEYDRKLDGNSQNIIVTKNLSAEDMLDKVTCIKFDSGIVVFKTQDDEKILQNDNTRNLIIGEELDANIQEPLSRGEPVPIKTGGVNGLLELDNGKVTLEDGNRTFNFHHTLSLEIKKTSTTLQDEIAAKKTEPSKVQQRKISKFDISIPDNELSLKTSKGENKWPDTTVVQFNLVYSYILPITESFSFSFQRIVKIQADDSDEIYLLKHNVHLECDENVNKKPKNIIATKKRSLEKLQKKCTHKYVSQKDMSPGVTLVVFRSGTVVFKTQDGRKVKLDGNLQNKIIAKELSGEEEVSKTTFVEFDSGAVVFKTQDAQKESAGYWKTIKIYSVPLTIIGMHIAIYCAYKIKTNHKFWEGIDMWLAAVDETLQYSIIPSKTITSSVLFDESKIILFTEKDDITLKNDNTRNLILSKELDENIQKPFPRGEPIPIKFDRFNGLLDNGKLILKTEDGNTTFTFHHTLSLEVKKTSTTLQDEADKEKEPFKQMKIGKFNVLEPHHIVTWKTSKGENRWPYTTVNRSDPVTDVSSNSSLKFNDAFPIIGSFSFSVDETVKIQADDSDEVYHLKQNVRIECDKKVDENLQNIIATEEVSLLDMIPGGTHSIFDCGTVVFKTQDGEKVIVRKKLDFIIWENGPKTEYLDALPQLSLQNGNSRNLILSKELDANIQEPFPRGEPVPIKTGGVNGLLDNGKLTLKTGDSDTTFTFHNTLILEVTKTSTTLQDEIAAKKYKLFKQRRISKFNVLIPAYKITEKIWQGEKTLPTTTVDHSDPVKDASRTFSSFELSGTFLATGNFSYSVEETVKIQADESDEVYHFKHNVKLECDKKVDENLQNMIATKEVSPDDIVDKGTNVTVNCGTVVFKTQDGRKM
ncbi:hypothetical protein HCN44_008022 [Aphidius gifuensis]|uniref:Uncharacterized protein n=1 Tax=Aphidius gifuensis TaxID=684658 RepID=A0A834XMZ0_APHGI|nr:hypothetical protein HCN44_008022 [Aphidius gifuensis]